MSIEATEIALRAYVVPKDSWESRYKPKQQEVSYLDIVAVIDTETTADQYQNLKFGSLGIWISGRLHRFILFHSDKLTGKELSVLRDYARKHPVEDVKIEVTLVSRFIDDVFYPWVYDAHALLIGFNLPFDISRLAVRHGLGRKKMERRLHIHSIKERVQTSDTC